MIDSRRGRVTRPERSLGTDSIYVPCSRRANERPLSSREPCSQPFGYIAGSAGFDRPPSNRERSRGSNLMSIINCRCSNVTIAGLISMHCFPNRYMMRRDASHDDAGGAARGGVDGRRVGNIARRSAAFCGANLHDR